MSGLEKIIQKIFDGCQVSYHDAERILLRLDFEISVKGSHHVFRKNGYPQNISLKKRSQLLDYQYKTLKIILQDHGYKK